MARLRMLIVLLATGAISQTAIQANAAALTLNRLLYEFNVVSLGDFTSTSNVEGRTYIGGNLNSNTSSDYNKFNTGSTATPPSDHDELVVNGSITGSAPINVLNGGDVSVGGTVSPIVNLNGGGVLSQGVPVSPTLSEVGSTLVNGSLALYALSPTASVNASDTNSVRFDATGISGGTTVYSIDYDDLATFSGLVLDSGSASAVVVNVTDVAGRDLTLTNRNFMGGSLGSAANFLWNFGDAGSITTHSWFGSIIAPGARLTNWTPIEGSVAVGSVESDSEFHLQPFVGIPQGSNEVPEIDAASGLGSIAALAAMLAFLRGRRRAAVI